MVIKCTVEGTTEEGITGAEGIDNMSEWYEDLFDWLGDRWSDIRDYYDPEHRNDAYLDSWKEAFENPDKLDEKMNNDPYGYILNPLLNWYKDKKIREDAEKWYNDLAANTGQTFANSAYKWLDYYTKGLGRYSNYGSASELFEASASVVNQFTRRLYKW